MIQLPEKNEIHRTQKDRTYIDKHWDYMIIFFIRDCGVSGGGALNPLESGQGTGIYTIH